MATKDELKTRAPFFKRDTLGDYLAQIVASAAANPSPKGAKPEAPPKTKAQLLFQGQLNPTRKRKIVRLEQWVEVTIQNGVTVTKQVPSNYHMIRKGQKMWPPPEYVYRRINFPNGVPDEYAWTCTLNPEVRENGGCGLQRMTVDDWLVMIEQEEKRTDGHIGRTIRGNLPRPAEHGECDCPVCTRNRPLMAVYDQAATAPKG